MACWSLLSAPLPELCSARSQLHGIRSTRRPPPLLQTLQTARLILETPGFVRTAHRIASFQWSSYLPPTRLDWSQICRAGSCDAGKQSGEAAGAMAATCASQKEAACPSLTAKPFPRRQSLTVIWYGHCEWQWLCPSKPYRQLLARDLGKSV